MAIVNIWICSQQMKDLQYLQKRITKYQHIKTLKQINITKT